MEPHSENGPAPSGEEPYGGVRLALEHVVQDVQNVEDLARRHAQAAHTLSDDLAALAGAWRLDSDWRNAPGVSVTVDGDGNATVGIGGRPQVEDAPMDAAGADASAEGDGAPARPARRRTKAAAKPAPMPEPESKPAEPEAEAKAYSLVDVRSLLAEKARGGFMDEVRGLLRSYGVTRLSDIRQEDYADVYAKGRGIGDASK